MYVVLHKLLYTIVQYTVVYMVQYTIQPMRRALGAAGSGKMYISFENPPCTIFFNYEIHFSVPDLDISYGFLGSARSRVFHVSILFPKTKNGHETRLRWSVFDINTFFRQSSASSIRLYWSGGRIVRTKLRNLWFQG